MNAAATDYAVLADRDLDPAAFAPALDTLRTLLPAEPAPLTRNEILTRWPSPTTPDAQFMALAQPRVRTGRTRQSGLRE